MKNVPVSHNSPPNAEAAFRSELAGRNVALLATREALLARAAELPETITGAGDASVAAELVKDLGAYERGADKARKDEKEPYLQRGRWVDAYFKGAVVVGIGDAKKTATGRLTAYQRKVAEAERQAREEAERQAREEAERARREAEERAAAAQTEDDLDAAIQAEEEAKAAHAEAERAAKAAHAGSPDLSRHRSSGGAVASLRTSWQCTGFDAATVDLEALRAHLGWDAIEKAIRAYIRAGGRELKGATIEEVTTSRVS